MSTNIQKPSLHFLLLIGILFGTPNCDLFSKSSDEDIADDEEDVVFPDIFETREVDLCNFWGRWAVGCADYLEFDRNRMPEGSEKSSQHFYAKEICEVDLLAARKKGGACLNAVDNYYVCAAEAECSNFEDVCDGQIRAWEQACPDQASPMGGGGGGGVPGGGGSEEALCEAYASNLIACFNESESSRSENKDACIRTLEAYSGDPDCYDASREYLECIGYSSCSEIMNGGCEEAGRDFAIECG